jgi:hypothetical protein
LGPDAGRGDAIRPTVSADAAMVGVGEFRDALFARLTFRIFDPKILSIVVEGRHFLGCVQVVL